MHAVDVARRFALGGAASLSDGPVARGKQGVVWRLETADGSWAVKVPQSGLYVAWPSRLTKIPNS